MHPLRLILRLAVLAVAVVPLLLVILVAVPDGNDYALATVDKHARLATAASHKMIFVGGSNLAYGLDSARVERELGYSVVNMGMNAYLGVGFVLEEVRRAVRPGDVVVLSFEYDMYFDSVDGYGRDLLMLVKVRPESLFYLRTPRQWLEVARNVPFAAQQKSLRLIHTLLTPGRRAPAATGCDVIQEVESRGGFNRYGDLVSHLEIKWPCGLDRPHSLEGRPVNAAVWPLLEAFGDDIRRRGARVLVLPPPIASSYYEGERRRVAEIYAQMERRREITGVGRPERYVWPDHYFFDSVYHTTAEGRQLRTMRIIEDLRGHVLARGVSSRPRPGTSPAS